jgi:predicted nucleic acid-binding protein
MILLDSNIVIYASKKEYSFLNDFLIHEDLAVSIITKIEVLGYHGISPFEKNILTELFNVFHILEINTDCVNTAIEIRLNHRLSLGDAIIAASAINHKLTLVTRNIKDFEKVKHLKLFNPFKK